MILANVQVRQYFTFVDEMCGTLYQRISISQYKEIDDDQAIALVTDNCTRQVHTHEDSSDVQTHQGMMFSQLLTGSLFKFADGLHDSNTVYKKTGYLQYEEGDDYRCTLGKDTYVIKVNTQEHVDKFTPMAVINKIKEIREEIKNATELDSKVCLGAKVALAWLEVEVIAMAFDKGRDGAKETKENQ